MPKCNTSAYSSSFTHYVQHQSLHLLWRSSSCRPCLTNSSLRLEGKSPAQPSGQQWFLVAETDRQMPPILFWGALSCDVASGSPLTCHYDCHQLLTPRAGKRDACYPRGTGSGWYSLHPAPLSQFSPWAGSLHGPGPQHRCTCSLLQHCPVAASACCQTRGLQL